MLDRTALAALASAFEAVARKALAYDPGSLARLRALDGQCLAIFCTAPEFTFYLLPGESIQLLQFYEGPVTCSLRGSAGELLKVAAGDSHSLHGTGVSLDGSAQLLAELQQILKTLDIDWEMWLADNIGTLPAHFIASQFRQARNWSRERARQASQLAGDYLREESGAGLGRDEFELFVDDINQTRLALDRLQARVEHLRNAAES